MIIIIIIIIIHGLLATLPFSQMTAMIIGSVHANMRKSMMRHLSRWYVVKSVLNGQVSSSGLSAIQIMLAPKAQTP